MRLAAGWTGALVAGGSELRLEVDPVMTLSLGSKKKAVSSDCFGYDGVGEVLLSCREPPW